MYEWTNSAIWVLNSHSRLTWLIGDTRNLHRHVIWKSWISVQTLFECEFVKSPECQSHSKLARVTMLQLARRPVLLSPGCTFESPDHPDQVNHSAREVRPGCSQVKNVPMEDLKSREQNGKILTFYRKIAICSIERNTYVNYLVWQPLATHYFNLN